MKALVVDDEEFKSRYISDVIREVFGDVDIHCAVSHRMAMLNLEKKYDLVVCDEFLGDGLGSTFCAAYEESHPFCKVLRYSGNDDAANLQGDTKCYPINAIHDELYSWKKSLRAVKKGTEIMQSPQKEPNPGVEEMKGYIPIVGAIIAIIGFGGGYGQLAERANATEKKFVEHCIYQKQWEKETSGMLEDLKIQNAVIVDQNIRTQKDLEELKKLILSLKGR